MSRDCFWPGCERRVKSHELGCPWHWYTLPYSLRLEIRRALKMGNKRAYAKLRREAIEFASRDYCDADTPPPDPDRDEKIKQELKRQAEYARNMRHSGPHGRKP